MAASGTLVTSDSFPNVARLDGQLGKDAAAQLGLACGKLRRAGAFDAADRLARIDGHVGTVDYVVLEKLADPELAAEELTASRQRPVRRAHTWRNGFALLPLLITWIALGAASIAYRDELAANPSQSAKPFLYLWEQGFGGRTPTFAFIAFADFGILLVVLVLTGWVHLVEGRAAQSRTEVIDGLYAALGTLEAAVERSIVRPPASAEEWADAAKRIITDAMEQTKQLAETGHEAIERASDKLAGIQDQGRDFIDKFSTDIRDTLSAVRKDNEQFISRAATEARETLQRLVEQQMDPLLKQLSTMLGEFGKHQETYRTGVADLAQGVTTIKVAARELADSAQAHNKIAHSIDTNLEKIASAQEDFTSRVATSADSMKTAAATMNEAKDVLEGMRDGVRQLAADIGKAGQQLDAVESNLADTSSALSDSTSALNRATRELRTAASSLKDSLQKRTFWNRRVRVP